MHVVYEVDLMNEAGTVAQQVNVMVKSGPKAVQQAGQLALKSAPEGQELSVRSVMWRCVVQAIGKLK